MTITIDNLTGEIVLDDVHVETLADAFEHLGKIGAQGADSILKAAMFATACVASKLASEEDAKELYLAYRRGYDAEVILGDNLVDDDKIKAHVSIFRTFMKAAVVKNGEIHARALNVRAKLLPEQRKHSAYNGLAAVNRAQIKKGAKPLTNDELEDILCKDEAVEKGEVEKLEQLLKAARKIEKDFGGMVSVISAIEQRLEAAKAAALASAEGEDELDSEEQEEIEATLRLVA